MLSARLNRYYGRLRRPPGQRSTSRFRPVIGRHAPAAQTRRLPGRGGPPQFPPPPSIRSAPPTPGSSSRLRFQALHRFHGLHPDYGGSALPCPALTGGNGYDAAGFASCYGPHRRSPFTGLLTLGSDPARFPAEPPACYRASWQLPGPDFHRQATTSLRTRRSPPWHYVTVSPPALLGAHNGPLSRIKLARGCVAFTVLKPGSNLQRLL
jgi:hypothetical protein